MQIATSNFQPARFQTPTFSEVFQELVADSDTVRMAVGYASAEALAEILAIVMKNPDRTLSFELVLGMHKFDGFTRQQYEASILLHELLGAQERGFVKVCTAFPYHGKVYSFAKANKVFAAAVGSSNMSSILDTHHLYETDIIVREASILAQISKLLESLSLKASKPICELPQPAFIASPTRVLEDVENVSEVSPEEMMRIRSSLTGTSFTVPVKSDEAPKSHLNVYFGKGRENTRSGFVRPRHWYESELIVAKNITQQAGYPQKGIHFDVVTDDGWSFKCNVNGDNSKNLRSSGNLQILGRWLKGRLEEAGCLKVGDMVTKQVLERYGRDHFTLTATSDHDSWYIDFSREGECSISSLGNSSKAI